MHSRALRVTAIVENNLSLLVVVLAVCALLGGYVTYATYVDTGVDVETEEVSRWSSKGRFTHSATVVNDTEVFEEGTVLRNRNAYFQRVAPVLNGSAVYSYDATDRSDLRVEGTLVLVLRSVSETDDGNVTEYWRIEEPLGTATEESLSPGERVRVPFSVNVSAMTSRVTSIEEQLGGTPGETEMVLQSRFEISGTRNGQQVDRTRVYEATISTNGNVYTVAGDEPTVNSGRQTREVTVPATYGTLRTVGGPLVMIIGLLGLVGLAVAHWQGATSLSEAEREWLDYQAARDEFDDWITAGRVPERALPETRVTVETLEGLVDIAIDCDRRVIQDHERADCLVTVDDIVYVYSSPSRPDGFSETDPLVTDHDRESGSTMLGSLFSDRNDASNETASESDPELTEAEASGEEEMLSKENASSNQEAKSEDAHSDEQ